ncbi:hypothetical protein Tco_1248768, partial [Tanacetum coccineum]
MEPLPPRDQRHPWFRYQVEGYTEDIVHNYEQRLKTIFSRLRMVYIWDEGRELLTSHAWRRLFKIRASLVREFILEFLSTYRIRDTVMGLHIAEEMAEDGFQAYWLGKDRHLKRHTEGRKSGARLSEGHFIGCLATHFGLVSDQGLGGFLVVTRELLLIDLHKLGRLNIYERIGYTWAWVAPRPKRQPDVAAGAPEAAEDAPAVDEGA